MCSNKQQNLIPVLSSSGQRRLLLKFFYASNLVVISTVDDPLKNLSWHDYAWALILQRCQTKFVNCALLSKGVERVT